MRLLGINIPDNKRIEVALTYFYGIGLSLSKKILNETNIDPNKRTKDLTADELNKIKNWIESNVKIEGALRQEIRQNINHLKEINCYRGIRHMRKLPVRGQRTKTNSRTVRGNVRKTVGSGKRKIELK
ncbi:MAG: 30S ribosomal protein S13 [Candidatus Parcubacteria bacterium]|nr:MAG: 30S ribosomal protein S13 [Candidatus Parcubacteria bacterium]